MTHFPKDPRVKVKVLNTPVSSADFLPQNTLYRSWNSIAILGNHTILGRQATLATITNHQNLTTMSKKDAKVAAAAIEESAAKSNVLLKGQLVINDGVRTIVFVTDWTDVVRRANEDFGTVDTFDVRKSSFVLPFARFKAVCSKKFDINGYLNDAKNIDKAVKCLLDNIGFDINFVIIPKNDGFTARDGFIYEPAVHRRAVQDITIRCNPAIPAKYPVVATTIEVAEDWV